MKNFILEPAVNDPEMIIKIINGDLESETIYFILRGILYYEVLYLALTKRWRVNYGVNYSKNRRLLQAVPFRAKDVPAERAQFSHPDVSIILTILSYYYSGLKED